MGFLLRPIINRYLLKLLCPVNRWRRKGKTAFNSNGILTANLFNNMKTILSDFHIRSVQQQQHLDVIKVSFIHQLMHK
jgi:hypothetical protein